MLRGGRDRTTASKFGRLAKQWKKETAHVSSNSQRAVHPAYQRIIGMGEAAIPFLLHELDREPDDWFWALNTITEADPVPARARGKMERIARAWITWGRKRGFV